MSHDGRQPDASGAPGLALRQRSFLGLAILPGAGAVLSQGGPFARLFTFFDPLGGYPNRDWERAYRDEEHQTYRHNTA